MKICIIGLGTIGSFLSLFMTDYEKLTELILIDYDTVENKNLKNTAFKKKHVGELKTTSMAELIRESKDIKVTLINSKYSEDIIELPNTDYIIDCRDFIYDRKGKINLRLYFSGRHLIIDCRKKITYKDHTEGLYLSALSKIDVINAISVVMKMFNNGIIDKFIKREMVYKQRLDVADTDAVDSLEIKESAPDIMYDNIKGEDLLINVKENIPKIFDMNQEYPINLYVGPKHLPVRHEIIPIKSLKNYGDVISRLTTALDFPIKYNYYLISIGKNFIELIPETGAA